jgi:cellulose synthase/poly-beta-1,6-N-acetylglucosamine synthase-like glycosyltransferase
VPLIVHEWAWLALPVIALEGVLVLGYLAWLLRGGPGVTPSVGRPATWPRVDVIVPVRNEARWIEGKLRNLAELRYPVESLRVFVVDGASTDTTPDIIAAHLARDSRLSLLRFPMADKIAQLNAGLRRGDAEWVVVTDADARLPVETLEQLMATGEADPSVAVVGAPVTPAGPLALEALHWRLGNYLRGREGRRGCASLVAGPCFAFRRSLLGAWPGDAVADDMHVTFTAMAAGRRVELIDVSVTELRSPGHLAELFRHKFRRAHAYLREVFRFVPRVPAMPSPARTVFLWRAAHLTILPLLLLVTAGLALGALGHAMTSPAGTLAIGTGMVAVAAACWVSRRVQSLATVVALGALIAVTLALALAALPFWRQRACFPKVEAAGQPTGEVIP